jgi:endogenous inhibitor of DNA gyrase (YacG/DUF329 family)
MKHHCEICGTAMPGPSNEWPDYPFCSPRCRKIDLGRWLGEKYRISGDPIEDLSTDGESPPKD